MGMKSKSSSSMKSKYVCAIYTIGIILLFIFITKLGNNRNNDVVTVAIDTYSVVDNSDIEYSEMLKDNEHKIIMDWTPRAACSAMVT